MSGTQESVASKLLPPESQEDQSSQGKGTSSIPSAPTSFKEDPFIQVLEKLKAPPAAKSTFQLTGTATSACSCCLGVVLGLSDGSVILVSPAADVKVLYKHSSQVIALHTTWQILVSSSEDKSIIVWSFETMQETAAFCEQSAVVYSLCVTPDEKRIIAGSVDGAIKIWDLERKQEVASLEGHTRKVNCLVVTPDGKEAVSGSDDQTFRVWSLERMQEVAVLEGHKGSVRCISLTLDASQLLSSSDDSTIKIWSLSRNQEIGTLSGHTFPVTCLSVTLDGKQAVSGSSDGTIKVWQLEELRLVASLEGHTGVVTCLSITADSRHVISGSQDCSVKIWSLQETKEIATFAGHKGSVLCLAVTNEDKEVVSGSQDQVLKVWSLLETRETMVLRGHTDAVLCLAVSFDGKQVVSGSDDNSVKIWSLETALEVASLQGNEASVNCVAFTPDGKRVISGSRDDKVKIWSLETTQEVASFQEKADFGSCLAVTADGRRAVSGSRHSAARVWSLESMTEIEKFEGHSGDVYCVSITPDGNQVVSGSRDKTVKVWNLEDAHEVATLSGHTGAVCCLAITLDGTKVISGSEDKTLKIWSLEEKTEIATLLGHLDQVTCVAVTSDGYVVSGSLDKTLKVWNIAETKEVAEIRGHTSYVTCLAITPSGKHVISGSDDCTLRLTDLTIAIPARRSVFCDTIKDQAIAPYQTYYFCGKYQEDLKLGVRINLSVAASPILPHCLNSLHICAHFDQHAELKFYLEHDVPIIRGVFGSPLTVALKRNTTKCIDVILRFFVSTHHLHSSFLPLQEITEDLPTLLTCNSTHLVPFFQSLLKVPIQPLPEFISPLYWLPFTLFRTQRWIQLTDFARFEDGKPVDVDGEVVQFWMSRFSWNFAPGSSDSLTLLQGLIDCNDSHILTTSFVTALVQSKWDRLLLFTRLHTFLYFCILVSMVCMTFDYWNVELHSIIFTVLNVIFLLYEMIQALANGMDYWTDHWNYVDFTRCLTSIAWGGLMCTGNQSWVYLQAVAVGLCFFRGFTYFRGIKMTRVFVRLVLEVVKEMYAFLVILAYSTFSFGVMFAIMIPDQVSGGLSAWTTSYVLLLGSFNTTFTMLQWILFVVASLLNCIVLLNLLVSVLGEAYGNAQASAVENDTFEMLQLIIEYESMLFWRRGEKESCVLIVCKSAEEGADEDVWSGRLNHIKRAVLKSGRAFEEKLAQSQTAIETKLEERLKESQASLETKLDQNRRAVESLETKLDHVLAALRAPR